MRTAKIRLSVFLLILLFCLDQPISWKGRYMRDTHILLSQFYPLIQSFPLLHLGRMGSLDVIVLDVLLGLDSRRSLHRG